MQAKMEEVQKELENKRVEGTSGGGMVKVVANGKQEILEIKIDPEVGEQRGCGDVRGSGLSCGKPSKGKVSRSSKRGDGKTNWWSENSRDAILSFVSLPFREG